MEKLVFLSLISLLCLGDIHAQTMTNKEFNLSSYSPNADGESDDTPAFIRLFSEVEKANGGTVNIPPGDYFLRGETTIALPSNTTVFAYGAKFNLPEVLGDMARVVLFQGENVTDFSWFGGFFKGYCFDPDNDKNTWEPNANSRIFVINTSENGRTENLTFRDISSDKIAGAVINVNGHYEGANINKVNFATNISVENVTLINSGKFMWDYGYLYQLIVWPEDYSKDKVNMAYKYFDDDLIIPIIKISDQDDKVFLNNTTDTALRVKIDAEVCFFNDDLPKNIIKGKSYYVVEEGPDFIKISDTAMGNPIRFVGGSGSNTKIIHNVREVFYEWAPVGAGPGKGSIDLVACKNTKITGSRISALGDAMHVMRSHNNVISNNHILGARMGAFFLAQFCKNSTVIGNTVEGSNGSRVVSVEKSNEDVTIIGNVFKNGGRGSWINQPKNVVIQNNIFMNNTTKGEKDPLKGRRDFQTGGWQSFPEIYFTTYELDGKYESVILKDNIFVTNSDAAGAIQFEKNGYDILVEGNIFRGATGIIMMDEEDETITIRNNVGAMIKKGPEYSKHLFINLRRANL